MEPLGTFAFVLHTHLPYSRNAGRWPHGEEWLFEAACETYIPLIEMLAGLSQSVGFALTASVTPVLAQQFAATDVIDGMVHYIEDRARRAQDDIARFERTGEAAQADLARMYAAWYGDRLHAFRDTMGGDFLGALIRLQEAGRLELITSAATHPYLPLLSRDSSVAAQLTTGVVAHERAFGRAPTGIWLPECAYRPAVVDADGVLRPPLEQFLARREVGFFFVESHAIEGGVPPTSTGHLAPWYAGANRLAPAVPAERPASGYTTALPYYVGRSPVAAIGRSRLLSMQVWSADGGYPGEARYREFHKRDSVSGMQYWAVTGPKTDLGDKVLYDPAAAREQVQAHARHFAAVVIEELEQRRRQTGRQPLVAAVFDTELFGHWWFEGVTWLRLVIEALAADGRVTLEPISRYLERHPPDASIDLPESSWGAAGDHRTWYNPSTQEMWRSIHESERDMERLVRSAAPERRRFVQQAARELMLLQSSDWPFLVTTGQARAYAEQRFTSHLERFRLLSTMAEAAELGEREQQYLDQVEATDELFGFLDPLWFAARQGDPT